MSQPAITARHYQALCGLALAAIFLLQLQETSQRSLDAPVLSLFMLFMGAVLILVRVRFSPMLVLLTIAAPHVVEQYNLNQVVNPDFRAMRVLDVADVLMCMAVLTYLIGQYRLHGLWFGVLPRDPRLPRAIGDKPAPPRLRSEESLTVAELIALVFTVPVFALLAELACLLLKQHWTLLDLPPRWMQLVTIFWTLLLVMFLAAHAFRYWRRLQLDRVGALILLQDLLWNETRGEQRRVNRWIVWKKLREMRKKL